MKCKRFTEALLALGLVLVAATARADDFKQHYEAGLALYSSEDYDAAIKEFQAAYAIKPKPRLLFNIGQAYRNIGNAKQALNYYVLYQTLESNPKPGLKAELEGYISQMKSIVAQAERARRAEDAAPAKPEKVADPYAAAAPPPTSPPSPTAPSPASATVAAPSPWIVSSAPSPKPARRPVYQRGWFWAVTGGAAATALVVGLAVGLGTSQSAYGGDVRHPTF